MTTKWIPARQRGLSKVRTKLLSSRESTAPFGRWENIPRGLRSARLTALFDSRRALDGREPVSQPRIFRGVSPIRCPAAERTSELMLSNERKTTYMEAEAEKLMMENLQKVLEIPFESSSLLNLEHR